MRLKDIIFSIIMLLVFSIGQVRAEKDGIANESNNKNPSCPEEKDEIMLKEEERRQMRELGRMGREDPEALIDYLEKNPELIDKAIKRRNAIRRGQKKVKDYLDEHPEIKEEIQKDINNGWEKLKDFSDKTKSGGYWGYQHDWDSLEPRTCPKTGPCDKGAPTTKRSRDGAQESLGDNSSPTD